MRCALRGCVLTWGQRHGDLIPCLSRQKPWDTGDLLPRNTKITGRNLPLLTVPNSWDILVIQECENPEKYESEKYYIWAKNHHYIWKGYNDNKGLGIFSKGDKIIKLDWPNKFPDEKIFNYTINNPEPFETTELLYFLPVEINNFVLVAVNTKEVANVSGKTFYRGMAGYTYTDLITEYLKLTEKQMKGRDIIFLGDFNNNINIPSNSKKLKKRIEDLMKNEFKNIGCVSLYHIKNDLEFGNEKHATHYYKCKPPCENKAKCKYNTECDGKEYYYRPDHIDYCFVSNRFQDGTIKIAEENEWERNKTWKGSDHCALIIELK
jgi:exonuclease III